ncbi:defensin Ec-AMP-D1-like [Ipomoea triloba]|uniref:defensin Ec-AMP-D1-like n=1 Tax=Ipomoea triloba TaxID=35885 RepID=UPI00125D0B6C|nr:defensin Ec-AMP-D1-like [Ipomoea triloba]
MASSLRSFAAALLFVIMFMATEVGRNTIMVVEARTCDSPSSKFKGQCSQDTNCATVCMSEGFSGGYYKGFRRRCICTKPC